MYYMSRKLQFLRAFDDQSQLWRPFIVAPLGENFAESLLRESRKEFEALLQILPYIGGDENHLTGTLVESASCLALYKAMQKNGRTVQECGKVLYDAALTGRYAFFTQVSHHEILSPAQLMEQRRKRAARSQERRYSKDYVYEFVAGDGEEFDYGYDFTECAVQKFFHTQKADEFTPFYCFLDFPKIKTGFRRTMTLSNGNSKCNHRFKEGRQTEFGWPPPFINYE